MARYGTSENYLFRASGPLVSMETADKICPGCMDSVNGETHFDVIAKTETCVTMICPNCGLEERVRPGEYKKLNADKVDVVSMVSPRAREMIEAERARLRAAAASEQKDFDAALKAHAKKKAAKTKGVKGVKGVKTKATKATKVKATKTKATKTKATKRGRGK